MKLPSYSPALPLALLLLVAACSGTDRTGTQPAVPSPAEENVPSVAVNPVAGAPSGTLVLPADPAVRTGTLPNGLRYYIRKNTEPVARAELRLAVDAGTALQAPDQGGAAHFLEHMLFNGTRRFEKMELVNFLERAGVRFGPHINAYTSLDETVYMLTIPTDSAEVVNRAFDVLEDWAAYATLSEEEIDKERGVIIEEYRLRRENAQGRIGEKVVPALLGDSEYTSQYLAGDPATIEGLDYDAIRRFYREWYRPGLMAVVAVGDFDVDAYEALIKSHFSSLPNPTGAPERPTLSVPVDAATRYMVVTDPEYPYTSVEVDYIRPNQPASTVQGFRENLVAMLFNGMLNARFAEIARGAGSPFLRASAYKGGLVRPAEIYGLSAQVQEDSILTGLESVLTEAGRIRQYGFTPTELDRQRNDVLRSYAQAYAERDNTNSASLAGEYVDNFLEGEPFPGIAYEYELVQDLLPQIGVGEVNELAGELLADANRLVMVTMPEKPALTPPSETALAGVIARVADKPIQPYIDAVSTDPLVENVPQPAAVVGAARIDSIGVTVLQFANGVRLVMKPTDFKEDEVQFAAFSPGGSSLVSDEEEFIAETAPGLVARSGVGTFSRTDLEKMLAGKVVSVQPYIGDLEEGIRGSASPEDLETLFQMIYLYFTAPRADSSALSSMQDQLKAILLNRSADPQAAFQDTLQAALYNYHPRRDAPTLADVASLNVRDALRIYKDRFADASDFTFIFVGNFDEMQLAQLAQTYLGTLPATQRGEAWRNVYPELPKGVVEKEAKKGMAPQSQVAVIFSGPFDYTRENRHALRSMEEVLSLMLREELREARGGTYGVGVNSSASDRPDTTYTVTISFTTAPERVDEMVGAVMDQVDRLKAEGPSADNVVKVREQQRRERETQLEQNGFWLGVLDYYFSHDNEPPTDVLRYNQLIESTSAADIQAAARRYLNADRRVRVVLYPENYTP